MREGIHEDALRAMLEGGAGVWSIYDYPGYSVKNGPEMMAKIYRDLAVIAAVVGPIAGSYPSR